MSRIIKLEDGQLVAEDPDNGERVPVSFEALEADAVSTDEAHRTGDIEDGLDSVTLGGDIGYYRHDDFRDSDIENRTGQATGPFYPSLSPSDTLYKGVFRPTWTNDPNANEATVSNGSLEMGNDTHVSTPSTFEYGVWRYEFELETALDGNDISLPFIAQDEFDFSTNLEIQLRNDECRIRIRDEGSTTIIASGSFPNEAGETYTLELERLPANDTEDRYRIWIDGNLEIEVTKSFDIDANFTRLRVVDNTPMHVHKIEIGDPASDGRSGTEISHLEVRDTDADSNDIGRIYLLQE